MAAPFDVQTRLTQISLAVMVEGMIADMASPRVDVGSEKFTYSRLDTAELFSIPDTRVGRRGMPNEVEFGARDFTESVEDYGLVDRVPIRDIQLAEAASANIDPLGVAVERTTVLVELAREQRVAQAYADADNYHSTHRQTLSGSSRWSDKSSDPISAILVAADKCLVRPNTLVLGQSVWTKLRQHPKVVEAVRMTGGGVAGTAGVVAQMALAETLELERILIGRSWHASSKKGQTASYARLWGKSASLAHLNPNLVSSMDVIPTFAFTAEWMGKRVTTYTDPAPGTDGCEAVKVIDCVKELLPCKDAGYLFQTAVS